MRKPLIRTHWVGASKSSKREENAQASTDVAGFKHEKFEGEAFDIAPH